MSAAVAIRSSFVSASPMTLSTFAERADPLPYEVTLVDSVQDYGDVYSIPNVQELHAAIALVRLMMRPRLLGSEVRFARGVLGYSQAEMASLVEMDQGTYAVLEAGMIDVGRLDEVLVRLAFCEALEPLAPGVSFDRANLAFLLLGQEPAPRDGTWPALSFIFEGDRWIQLDA